MPRQERGSGTGQLHDYRGSGQLHHKRGAAGSSTTREGQQAASRQERGSRQFHNKIGAAGTFMRREAAGSSSKVLAKVLANLEQSRGPTKERRQR